MVCCEWIPQNVSGTRKCKWNPHTVNEFQALFITELAYEQLKARTGILIFNNEEFKSKNLNTISGIYEEILKHLLTNRWSSTFSIWIHIPANDFWYHCFGNSTPHNFIIWSHWGDNV